MKLKKIIKRMNLKKDMKMKMLGMYLIINVTYLLVGSHIFFTQSSFESYWYKDFSIGLRYLFVSNIIVFLIIFLTKLKKKDFRFFKKHIYIGILFCIIFGIISMIFAVDKNIALEGYNYRYEGLYSILYYLTLMLLSTFVSKKYKKVLVNSIIICGAVQAIYAICQCFGLFNVKQVFHAFKYYDETIGAKVFGREVWTTGFTNNPNFFGTYMLLCLSYSLGLFIDSKKIWKYVIYSILSCIFMFVLLATNTVSCILGLAFVFAYILIYCLKNKHYIKLLAAFLILFSATILTVKLEKTKIVEDVASAGNEITEVAKGNFDDKYGTRRMYIWKETMKIIPNHLLHGAGIDNFAKAFNGKGLILQDGKYRVMYDKAHNEYLQTLVTQGIFAFASYLFVYGYTVYVGIKNSFKNKEIYLVLPVIGYLVQAFFNISVIEVAPIFYMALGLCCCNNENNKDIISNNKNNKEIKNNSDDSITVLMTTFNEEKEIFSKAIQSILKQTYSNIKILIIVDNKENKEIIELVKKYKHEDNRISYIINEQNLGLAESLNKGIDIIDTKYIARMDADDIAFENRIEMQLKFAKENPQIDLFGANIRYIDYNENILYARNEHAMSPEKIRKAIKYINIFCHSTFFSKTDILKKYKYRDIRYSQDYDLICRLLEDNCIIGNMEDCLLYYRKSKRVNEEKRYIQKISHFCIQKLYKKGKLKDTDIKKYIQKKLYKNDTKKEKIAKGFLLYDKSLEEYKQKKYFRAILDCFHSLFLSKYQIIEIKNLINYEIIK